MVMSDGSSVMPPNRPAPNSPQDHAPQDGGSGPARAADEGQGSKGESADESPKIEIPDQPTPQWYVGLKLWEKSQVPKPLRDRLRAQAVALGLMQEPQNRKGKKRKTKRFPLTSEDAMCKFFTNLSDEQLQMAEDALASAHNERLEREIEALKEEREQVNCKLRALRKQKMDEV